VIRFLHARFRDPQASGDVFAQFTEDLWLGLPNFRFECSLRAWVFILARNAGHRHARQAQRQQRAQVPLSDAPEVAALAQQIRTSVFVQLATPRERRLARLREELSPEEQELLTLRVDRELEFAEIALITLGDASAAPESVTREAARLRKRFQLLKDRLRRRWAERDS
jgi:RNA polymerase sigma-70 factor (ECF subfamily)